MGRTNSCVKGGGRRNDLSLCKTAGFSHVTGNDYPTDMYFYFDGDFSLSLDNFFSNTSSLTELNSVEIEVKPPRKPTSMTSTFFNASRAKKIILNFDTSSTGYYRTFYACSALKEIDGILDFTAVGATDNGVFQMFISCKALEEVRFAYETLQASLSIANSPNLSLDSLASITNGLADLTGSTSKTLTLHATAKAKLTSEQIATITAKNWTLA